MLEPDARPGWEPTTLELDARVYVWRGADERLRLYHRELSEVLDPPAALEMGWAQEVEG